MNFYVRYFDHEVLVPNIEELIEFLEDIPEIQLSDATKNDIRAYAVSDIGYPKRVKVRPRVYFIIIKTEAASMQDFKDKKAVKNISAAETKAKETMYLSTIKPGWYEGILTFKRVVTNNQGKCEYRDTTFGAQMKAESVIDCYNKICEHLSHRVDSRSQFPSAKGKNFQYRYLGLCKPIAEEGEDPNVDEAMDNADIDMEA